MSEQKKSYEELEAELAIANIDRYNAERELSALKARLADRLALDYADFHDADNMKMSVELGENFRRQINNIFRILNKEGIKPEEHCYFLSFKDCK